MVLSPEMIRFDRSRILVDRGPIHFVYHQEDEKAASPVYGALRQIRDNNNDSVKKENPPLGNPFLTPVIEGLIASPIFQYIVAFKGAERFHDFTDWVLDDKEWERYFGHKPFVLLSMSGPEDVACLKHDPSGHIAGKFTTPHVPIVPEGDSFKVELVGQRFMFVMETHNIFLGTPRELRIRGQETQCTVEAEVNGVKKMGQLQCAEFPEPTFRPTNNEDAMTPPDSGLRIVRQNNNNVYEYFESRKPVVEVDENRFIFFDKKRNAVYAVTAGEDLQIKEMKRPPEVNYYQCNGKGFEEIFVVMPEQRR